MDTTTQYHEYSNYSKYYQYNCVISHFQHHSAQVERHVCQWSEHEEPTDIFDELDDVLLLGLTGPFSIFPLEILSIFSLDPILIDADPHHHLVS